MRSLTVTGVQRCALPISRAAHARSHPGARRRAGPSRRRPRGRHDARSEEHTSELQSQSNLVCRLLLEKKKKDEEIFECPRSRYVVVVCFSLLYGHEAAAT